MDDAARRADGLHHQPANRRNHATEAWGRENGITAASHSGTDLHRLRSWDLID